MTEASSESETDPTRILILEDDDEFVGDVKGVSRSITERLFDWSHATSIDEALDIASEKRPDIAIVDVGLEDENGLDFVQAARDQSFVFPIILISQDDLHDVVYRGSKVSLPRLMEFGANEFYSKTEISGDQKRWLILVAAMARSFNRLYRDADKPDREFHTAVSKAAIVELAQARTLCQSIKKNRTKSNRIEGGYDEEASFDHIVMLLESIADKERIRLEYSAKFSVQERLSMDSVNRNSPRPNFTSSSSLLLSALSQFFSFGRRHG